MKYVLIIFVLCFNVNLKGQNIVLNKNYSYTTVNERYALTLYVDSTYSYHYWNHLQLEISDSGRWTMHCDLLILNSIESSFINPHLKKKKRETKTKIFNNSCFQILETRRINYNRNGRNILLTIHE